MTLEPIAVLIAPAEWETLSERFGAELELLSTGGLGRWLLFVAVVFVVAWITVWAIGAAARFWTAFFPDPRRRSEAVATILEVVAMVAAVVVALRPLVARAPLVSGTVVLIALLILSRVLAAPLQNLLAGLELSRRKAFVEGDRVTVGGVTGVVARIGLWRTQLTAPDGSKISMPNREIAGRGITVGGTMGAERVRVELDLPAAASPEDLERLRRALVASPFRLHDGAASVSGDGTRKVVAELETWASRQTEEVGRRLTTVLRAALHREAPEESK
jgi:small-conductance mechanosensitive channel